MPWGTWKQKQIPCGNGKPERQEQRPGAKALFPVAVFRGLKAPAPSVDSKSKCNNSKCNNSKCNDNNSKCNSRFPSGMTERKATATADRWEV